MSAILPVPHYRQSKEGYCLPACARMVLAYLGIERTEAEISQLLGTRGIGTPGFAIQRLTAWGVRVDASRSSVRNALGHYQSYFLPWPPNNQLSSAYKLFFWTIGKKILLTLLSSWERVPMLKNFGYTTQPNQSDQPGSHRTGYSRRGANLVIGAQFYHPPQSCKG